MAYQSVNPFNGQVLKTFNEHSDEQVSGFLDCASRCFQDKWRNATFAERASIAHKAASIMRTRADDFAQPVTLEMGKLIGESHEEVALSADIIDYYADNAEAFLAPQPIPTKFGEATIESTPLGVLLGIEPWNFPYYQLARFVAPSLMAGNVVMVKHASSVPQCAMAFERAFTEAGAPDGVYTNLLVSKNQLARLIQEPRVRGVGFTGGDQAGAVVAAQAGQAVKKSTMELGGSDPLIVLDDADLEKTVKWAVWGRMFNNGQCCVASKRMIAVGKLADSFVSKFKDALAVLKAGDPLDKATTLAPMSSESALQTLLDQVKRATAGGARVVLGGNRIDRQGAFMQPTILTGITRENPTYYEEFFGPVTLFFRVGNDDEAIRLANDSPYGLGGSVFSTNIDHGKWVANRIETGMVFINHPTWTRPEFPFGGIKRSGYGRELSSLGIQEFVNKKLIRVVPIDAPEV